MDDPEDLQRLVGKFDPGVEQRRLVGAAPGRVVPRAGVPGRGYHRLVVGDASVPDRHPVAERPPGRLMYADASGFPGPGGRVELGGIGDGGVAAPDVFYQFVHEVLGDIGADLRFEAPAGGAAEHRRQPGLRPQAEHLGNGVHLGDHHLFHPGRLHEPLGNFGIDDDVARQGADFRHLATPLGCFDPGVFAVFVEVFPVGPGAFLGAGVLRLGHAVPGMAVAGLGIGIPGVRHALGECGRLDQIAAGKVVVAGGRRALAEVFHHSVAAEQQVLIVTVVGDAAVLVVRVIPVTQHAGFGEAAAVGQPLLGVDGGDGQQVGQIVVVDRLDAEIYRGIRHRQPLGVDRGVHIAHR